MSGKKTQVSQRKKKAIENEMAIVGDHLTGTIVTSCIGGMLTASAVFYAFSQPVQAPDLAIGGVLFALGIGIMGFALKQRGMIMNRVQRKLER